MDISRIIFGQEELVHVLLDEIEARSEFLIDFGNENYKGNEMRFKKWQEVADNVTKAAREFFVNQNVEFDFKESLSGEDAKKKYRNLRSTFNKKMKHKNGETGNWPFFDSMYRMYKSITRSIDETEKSIENTIKSNFNSNKIAYSTDSSSDNEHSPSTSNDAFDDNSPSMVIHPNKRRKNDPVTELVDSVINHFKERGRIPATNDNTTISNDEEYCLLQLPPNDRIMISGLIRMFYALMNKSDSHRTAGMDMLQNLINSLYSTNDPTRLRMVITER